MLGGIEIESQVDGRPKTWTPSEGMLNIVKYPSLALLIPVH
jgi:hypothetical protein